ncbi:hypothetical protein HOLleu_16738 [Holothuria leucospilota]|uniref:Uncharacterized protein n=1 Tax=Holothuria leucospilota TaxID=206669 RepID=A0A9Q1HAM6_HOLLE|nr:hypothetical protein HOLleu_16738 [Holothuria leucospilota]
MCFTETWLNPEIPDSAVEMDNFTLIRADRTHHSGKSKGGGVCLYFNNNNWCKNCVVKEKFWCEDIEFLTIGLPPFYLPREFGRLLITAVYIHLKASNSRAIEVLSERIQSTNTSNPDAIELIMEDFNKCNSCYTNFVQFVGKCTRGKNVVDKYFGNVKYQFRVKLLPFLGNSDHKTMYLLSLYRWSNKRSRRQKLHTKFGPKKSRVNCAPGLKAQTGVCFTMMTSIRRLRPSMNIFTFVLSQLYQPKHKQQTMGIKGFKDVEYANSRNPSKANKKENSTVLISKWKET